MNWRNKAITMKIIEKLPFSNSIYYFLQYYVTKSIPRKTLPLKSTGYRYLQHAIIFEKYYDTKENIQNITLFEFGGGGTYSQTWFNGWLE